MRILIKPTNIRTNVAHVCAYVPLWGYGRGREGMRVCVKSPLSRRVFAIRIARVSRVYYAPITRSTRRLNTTISRRRDSPRRLPPPIPNTAPHTYSSRRVCWYVYERNTPTHTHYV
jgi:hypothetical protein